MLNKLNELSSDVPLRHQAMNASERLTKSISSDKSLVQCYETLSMQNQRPTQLRSWFRPGPKIAAPSHMETAAPNLPGAPRALHDSV